MSDRCVCYSQLHITHIHWCQSARSECVVLCRCRLLLLLLMRELFDVSHMRVYVLSILFRSCFFFRRKAARFEKPLARSFSVSTRYVTRISLKNVYRCTENVVADFFYYVSLNFWYYYYCSQCWFFTLLSFHSLFS